MKHSSSMFRNAARSVEYAKKHPSPHHAKVPYRLNQPRLRSALRLQTKKFFSPRWPLSADVPSSHMPDRNRHLVTSFWHSRKRHVLRSEYILPFIKEPYSLIRIKKRHADGI